MYHLRLIRPPSSLAMGYLENIVLAMMGMFSMEHQLCCWPLAAFGMKTWAMRQVGAQKSQERGYEDRTHKKRETRSKECVPVRCAWRSGRRCTLVEAFLEKAILWQEN